jgi:hypothetical protein
VWLHALARIQTARGFSLGCPAALFRLALGLRLSYSHHLRLAGLSGGFRLSLRSVLISFLGFLGGLVPIANLHTTIGPAVLTMRIGPAVLTPVAIAAGGRTRPAMAAAVITAHTVVAGPVAAAIMARAAAVVAAGVAPATTIAATPASAATPSTSATAAVPSAPTASTVLGVGDAGLAVGGKRLQICQEGHDGKSQHRNREVSDELIQSHFLVLLRGWSHPHLIRTLTGQVLSLALTLPAVSLLSKWSAKGIWGMAFDGASNDAGPTP